MIIDSSLVSMASSHSLVEEYKKTEELTVKVSNAKPQAEESQHADKVSISDKAHHHLEKDRGRALKRQHMDRDAEHPEKGYGNAMKHLGKDLDKALKHFEKHMDKAAEHPERGYRKAMNHLVKDLDKAIEHLEEFGNAGVEKTVGIKSDSPESDKLGLLKNLLEDMTGRKIRLHDVNDTFKKHHKRHDNDHHDKDHVKKIGEKQQWEVSYNMEETLNESEQMNFNSSGIVRTADGREISFSLDLMMSRQYIAENKISLEASGTGEAGTLVDFAGPASALIDTKFGFGIEPEESADSQSYLALGSGILTLDLNSDGQIDSINELVGTTGNGFEELAAHDLDGNGWIDENDAIYDSLQILSQGSAGIDVLSGLKESNIGAINLGSVDSPYSLKNDQNVTVGQIDKSGIYLAEDGTAGQVQQLSMIV